MLGACGFTGTAGETLICTGIILHDHPEPPIFLWVNTVEGHIVPDGEQTGNVDAVGTGHAVAAAGAADLGAADVGSTNIVHELQFFLTHDAGIHSIEDPQVFINLFRFVAAGQDYGYFRMVAEPAESPFHGRTFYREGIIKCLHVVRCIGQTAAEEAFHDDYRDALASGKLQALGAGLIVDVHEVILNLAHIPIPVIEDILEFLVGAVEGEALVADLSFLFHIIKELRRADGFHMLPLLLVHGMHEVEVDMVCLQLFQLFRQDGFHIRTAVDRIRRDFGSDGDLVAVTVLQGFTQDNFGCFVQIDIGGVDVGDAAVDGPANQGDGFLFVNDAVSGGGAIETHAAQAEGRGFDAEFTHGAVFHIKILLPNVSGEKNFWCKDMIDLRASSKSIVNKWQFPIQNS